MRGCPWLHVCSFYQKQGPKNLPVSSLHKIKYCLGDFGACARHSLFQELGSQSVPDDLTPDESEKALRLLAKMKPQDTTSCDLPA